MKLSVRFVLVALLGIFLAACGDDHDNGSDQLRGTILIDGSSTVFPLTEAVAEEFMRANRGVRVTVGVSGTGGGFSRFVRGETDISNASRPIRSDEAALAEQNGIEYIELPVAFDGLAVVAHPDNAFAECLTVDELKRVWERGSTINNWNQVRSDFPNRPLRLYGTTTDSGTYDYFTTAIIGERGASRTEYTGSADQHSLVQGISGDQYSLGFFGLAYYEGNADRLHLVAIDNGDGCVSPTAETISDGTYQPLARPEFIYVRRESADRPEVEAFVDFYLRNAGQFAGEVGYVGLPEEAYDLGRQNFVARHTGSMFGADGAQIGVRIEDLLRREREFAQEGADRPNQD